MLRLIGDFLVDRSFEFWLHDFFSCILEDFDDAGEQPNRVTHPTMFVQFGILCSEFSATRCAAWNYGFTSTAEN